MVLREVEEKRVPRLILRTNSRSLVQLRSSIMADGNAQPKLEAITAQSGPPQQETEK